MTNDDEWLLAELGEGLRSAGDVPPEFIAAGKAALAWRAVDAELATLIRDSDDDRSLAGTRAEAASLRSLSFVAGDLSIEVEVTADALLGQVVPPQPGQVELGTPAGSAQTVPVDEVGWFVIQPVPQSMFRLHLSTSDGAAVITQWVTL